MDRGFERVLLLDEQRELLVRVVDAWRRQPREDRQKFLMLSVSGGELLMHPGIRKGDERVAQEDIETLCSEGLLSGRWVTRVIEERARERLPREALGRQVEQGALTSWFRDGVDRLVHLLEVTDLATPVWTVTDDRSRVAGRR